MRLRCDHINYLNKLALMSGLQNIGLSEPRGEGADEPSLTEPYSLVLVGCTVLALVRVLYWVLVLLRVLKRSGTKALVRAGGKV